MVTDVCKVLVTAAIAAAAAAAPRVRTESAPTANPRFAVLTRHFMPVDSMARSTISTAKDCFPDGMLTTANDDFSAINVTTFDSNDSQLLNVTTCNFVVPIFHFLLCPRCVHLPRVGLALVQWRRSVASIRDKSGAIDARVRRIATNAFVILTLT